MASIKLNKNMQEMPVSVKFIDEYLPKANAVYVKIYIYALRHSFSHSDNFSVESIAADLSVVETDVINAFKYWNKEGIIKFELTNGEYYIEFLNIDKLPNANENRDIKDKKRPRYSAKEIAVYMEQDKSVKDMYVLAEQILGKTLSTSEITTVYSFYDWLKLPKNVVLMLLEYCASIGKTNIRYIEKVALSWAENNVNTVAKAKKSIDKFIASQKLIGKMKSIFQIGDRNFTESELKYVNVWINEYKVTEEIIKKAYDITIMNTSKLSYPYLNSVLKTWYENGGEFKTNKDKKPTKKGFNNYSEERNLSDFEKQMLDRLVKNKG